jgi:hypothetical protein
MLTYIHSNTKESITIRITQIITKNNLNQEEITTNQETQSHESTSHIQPKIYIKINQTSSSYNQTHTYTHLYQ